MHLLLLDEVRPEPWRNGGGVTRPLVSAREAGSASTGSASADWRLSLADISADAEFSVFPGMQRHAVLLGSGAVSLASNGAEPEMNRRMWLVASRVSAGFCSRRV